MNKLTIVANAGRSGSTYLYSLLKNSLAENVYVAHEDIPVQVSKPRVYNRAYSKKRIAEVLGDSLLFDYIKRWKEELINRDVIETGWTCYHLLPVFAEVFGDALQVVVLHRNPWGVALSRANMGNFHPYSWYDDSHEVSPFDRYTIAPEFQEIWGSLNHAEKCLYWWYVVYREVDEFLEKNPTSPSITISSNAIFRGDNLVLENFISHKISSISSNVNETNPVSNASRETYPIIDEYKSFSNHQIINQYAKDRFNYDLRDFDLEKMAEKYAIPDKPISRIRNKTRYWVYRREIGRSIKSLIK